MVRKMKKYLYFLLLFSLFSIYNKVQGQSVPYVYKFGTDSIRYKAADQKYIFLFDNNYLSDKYIFNDDSNRRNLTLSFEDPSIMKIENISYGVMGRFQFIDIYRYHYKDRLTIVVDSLISTNRNTNTDEPKKEKDYVHPFDHYNHEFSSQYSIFPIIEKRELHLSSLLDRIQILDFLFVIDVNGKE